MVLRRRRPRLGLAGPSAVILDPPETVPAPGADRAAAVLRGADRHARWGRTPLVSGASAGESATWRR